MAMIPNIIIAIGVIGASISFIDFILDEKQKEKISLLTTRAWYFLDELKDFSLVNFVNHHRKKIIFCSTVILVALQTLPLFFVNEEIDDLPTIQFILALKENLALQLFFFTSSIIFTIIGAVLSNLALKNLLSKNNKFIMKRFFLSLFIFICISGINFFFLSLFRGYHLPGYLDLLIAIPEIIIAIVGFVVAIVCFSIIIPLIVMYTLIVVIYLSEAVVRKVAQNPNGPVIGAGLFISIVGGLMKAME